MLEATVRVALKEGLHARPATEFVKLAAKFASSVKLGKEDKFVDAKSILGVMSLAIAPSQEVVLKTSGTDEAQALKALEDFLQSEAR